jgi:hypothetical protein
MRLVLHHMQGGHLFVLNKDSIFFRWQAHVTLMQKLAYCMGPIAHVVQLLAEPVIFTMPLFCIIFQICAFGMDKPLFFTHVFRILGGFIQALHATEWKYIAAGHAARTGSRVQWFTSVKAVINTIMVLTGWKRPPQFKLTPKMKKAGELVHDMPETSVQLGSPIELAQRAVGKKRSSSWWSGKQNPQDEMSTILPSRTAAAKEDYCLVHKQLSKVTEKRKLCMPLDGTFDVWVIVVVFVINLLALVGGVRYLYWKGALAKWGANLESVVWLGVIWAAVELTPGALFLGCDALPSHSPRLCCHLHSSCNLLVTLLSLYLCARWMCLFSFSTVSAFLSMESICDVEGIKPGYSYPDKLPISWQATRPCACLSAVLCPPSMLFLFNIRSWFGLQCTDVHMSHAVQHFCPNLSMPCSLASELPALLLQGERVMQRAVAVCAVQLLRFCCRSWKEAQQTATYAIGV